MEVWVRAVDLYRLVPDHGGGADCWTPMEFDESRFKTIRVDEPEGVDSEPLHHPKRARDGAVGHDPEDHVHAFRQEGDEKSPERVMGRRVLGIAARSGSILTEWMRSGNLIASWMKKTGMLLPTRSKLPSSV